MNSENADVLTAIVSSLGAGTTRTARQIGLDGASVSCPNSLVISGRFDDNSGQVVADNSGICVDGVARGKGMKITSADTNLFYPDQRFFGSCLRSFALPFFESSRCFQYDLPHCLPATRRHWSIHLRHRIVWLLSSDVNMISVTRAHRIGHNLATWLLAALCAIWKVELDARHPCP